MRCESARGNANTCYCKIASKQHSSSLSAAAATTTTTSGIHQKTYLDGNHILQKANESSCLALVWKIKVHTISKGFNAQTPSMRPMFENQLFQIQKGSLVTDTLSNLDERFPSTLSKFRLTIDALLIANDVFHHEGLLQDGTVLNFFLNRQANLESHRMWFGPDPARIDESGCLFSRFTVAETTDKGQAQAHQFL